MNTGMELFGFWSSLAIGSVGFVMAWRQEGDAGRRRLHLTYAGLLLLQAALFAYFQYGTSTELARLKLEAEEKAKLSTQATKLYGSFPVLIGRDNCQSVVLTSFSFLSRWNTFTSDVMNIAKAITVRATAPDAASVTERTGQEVQCEKDARAMMQLIKGLSVQ